MYLQIVLFLFLISFPICAEEDQKLIETYTSTLVLSHNMLNINLSLALITVTFLFLSFNLILWYVRQFGKLWKVGVISQKKKFLASHIWPDQSKLGGSKYKPCKISPVKPFLVIFWIFPNTFCSFITLAEVLEAKKLIFGHVQFGTQRYSLVL